MGRRGATSIAANPVLIGAATTLVVVVAVFLAYNANNGLPFVPTYRLKVDVPNAAQLLPGNEVRIGGTRVGVVKAIRPKRLENGRVIAQLDLQLETTVKPLPKDSTILIRPRSALGLKYVQIAKGTSADGYADGATVPLAAARPVPVEVDEFLGAFDDQTRAATQQQLLGFGDAFAGRGQDLHEAIQALPPLLQQLGPVMANLSDDHTQLDRLFRALGRTAATVAPVAETQAALLRNLDTTFGGLASIARPYLQDTISGAPAALDTATRELPKQRPFLANGAALFRDLQPGVTALSGTANDLADALVIGTPALRRAVGFNEDLEPTFETLQRFAEDPLVALGVTDLNATARVANPLLATITPAQTVCNYWTLMFRNAASLLSSGDGIGTGQRFTIVATPQGPNNEGSPSAAPAAGPNLDNFLHANPYPNAAAPGQTKECEAGNEPYLAGRQVIGHVPGNQGTSTSKTKRPTATSTP